MAVQTVPRPASSMFDAGTALTDKGATAVALLRFERLIRALGPAYRRWFAEELAALVAAGV